MPPKAKAKASSASSSSSSAAQTAVVKAPDTSQTLPSKEQTLFKQILVHRSAHTHTHTRTGSEGEQR